MTLHCAFIGFGKSTTRYHLPYVLNRKGSWHVAHIFRRHAKPEEQAPIYSHIHFTSDLDEVLNDPQVKLVIVCTHADSHFDYARRAGGGKKRAGGKTVYANACRGESVVRTGAEQRADRHAVPEPPL